LLDHI